MRNINKILIIIPSFNEEKNISYVVRGIKEQIGNEMDILVVDDGSKDLTANKARESGAYVVRLPLNLGYGIALKTGYRYALLHGYNIVIQMDADGQHESASIHDLVKPIIENNAKVVIGSRFLGESTYSIPIERRIGQLLFAKLLELLTKKKITDPTSGFQAIHSDVLRLYTSDNFPADYPDADVLLLLFYKGHPFIEIPVIFHGSMKLESMHSGLKPVYYIYKMLLSMFLVACRYGFLKRFTRQVKSG